MATRVKVAGAILDLYESLRPNSLRAHTRARRFLPNGVEHDMRLSKDVPFPLYVDRAEGAYKWDVDGHRYVDYVVGHGALLLGQNHPAVIGPVEEALKRGTHFGATHEKVFEWADKVCELVPSAEMVRFLSSGTEATMMAIRMCRALTGREHILKFEGHFHGWHDHVAHGVSEPFEVPMSSGIPGAVRDLVTAIPINDANLFRDTLMGCDYACVILEPSGAHWGSVPTDVEWVRDVRKICTEMDVPLIFDEVVTGFRFSPGGYQGEFGITPDLTTLAKIVAGGFPGGAVAGQRRFIELIEMRDEPGWNRGGRISHPGTYNANPLSATAGVACLKFIADGAVHEQANRMGDRLRCGLQKILARRGAAGRIYGSHSFMHVTVDGKNGGSEMAMLGPMLQTAMLLHGVHISVSGGMTSAVMTTEDIDFTINAFDQSLEMLGEAGLLA